MKVNFIESENLFDIGDNTLNQNIEVEFEGFKDVTTAIEASELEKKADLESPVFTGTPKAPTAVAGTNNRQLATTAFVQTAIKNKPSVICSVTQPNTQSQGDYWYEII